MADLIDRADALKRLDAAAELPYGSAGQALQVCRSIIREMPPAGPEEAEWVKLRATSTGGRAFKCPACGTRITVEDGEMDFEYCPYCGMHMRLEGGTDKP